RSSAPTPPYRDRGRPGSRTRPPSSRFAGACAGSPRRPWSGSAAAGVPPAPAAPAGSGSPSAGRRSRRSDSADHKADRPKPETEEFPRPGRRTEMPARRPRTGRSRGRRTPPRRRAPPGARPPPGRPGPRARRSVPGPAPGSIHPSADAPGDGHRHVLTNEGLQLVHHRPRVFGRNRRAADRPFVDVLVLRLEQPLERIQFGLAQLGPLLVAERAQHHVGLAEAAPPAPEAQTFQA